MILEWLREASGVVGADVALEFMPHTYGLMARVEFEEGKQVHRVNFVLTESERQAHRLPPETVVLDKLMQRLRAHAASREKA